MELFSALGGAKVRKTGAFVPPYSIGIKTNNGIEVLIHIGIDTVNLNGQGFNVLVK